ncbi:anaerobic dimethyl sulfoxide reductase subunit C (anchor subunit) [Desulfohalotomaculum tongense]|uniref:dimethyl sulfoxide reductase anchor subunit family protein n=1 Tax=Desulforadius tongensis TaxID=1216062 RepID=UPI00195D5632|nr:DmsC/YnfH family molybdoenzyme membrane anchor subunit [Desulforadius tongensis]MBM7854111.1 anaerobic dimethyl sulfoxide reductase subunit C (anchor subunit) [Desulforadius tongensis]
MGEWPLIIFTLAMQAAAGVCLWTVYFETKKNGADFRLSTPVALGLSAVAMIVSLFHLGTPVKAINSLSNLSNSWLSREILFSGTFLTLLAVSVFLQRANLKNERLKKFCTYLNGIAGCLVVFSMAMVYMNSIKPAWESWNTLVDFYATALVLGGVILVMSSRKEMGDKLLGMNLILVVVVLLQIALLPNFLVGLGAGNAAAQASVKLIHDDYGAIMFLRWLLVLGGMILMLLSQVRKKQDMGCLYMAAAALVAGQVMGRYLFYAVGVATGIGLV